VDVKRRSFLALASGLLVVAPEPVRAYSFVGGWRGEGVNEWLDRVVLELFGMRRLPGEGDWELRARVSGEYFRIFSRGAAILSRCTDTIASS
jgi:hypothetical protein